LAGFGYLRKFGLDQFNSHLGKFGC
jgi:hypothetical protein